MKKILFFAALVLGLASCSTDPEDLNVVVGGEREVMLNVSLPEATRANSANGFQISDLGSTYDLRYILEVYRVDDEGNILYENCQRQVKRADAATMSFPVRLAPKYNYQIVAWADIVNDGSDADRLYDTSNGLDAIEILSWNAMDETRDAYAGTKYIADFSSASNLSMELTRPFAKVRVVATDINDITALGLSPKAAKVSYSQKMYTKYNAVTAEASAAQAKSHEYTYTSFPYTDATGEMTLFADYVFVPELGTAKFTLKVYDDEAYTRLIKENSFSTEIFVERNKITTIKGDVLTEGGNVSVKVENELGVKEVINIVDTANSLIDAIEDAEPGKETNIELGGDIDLGDLFGISTLSTRAAATLPIVIPEGKVVALDLNGYKITTPWDDQSAEKHHYAFENHGSLTIQDSSEGKTGEIIARGIFNYGTMTLESGKINACDHNGGYGVRNYKGTFTMNGGSIVTSNENGDDRVSGNYDASPLRVDANATATIKGGNITNVSNYTVAIDNYGTTTIEGGTFTSVHSTIANAGTMTIKGDATTIKCEGEYTSAHPIYANGEASNTYVNGGNFIGNDKASCYYVAAEKNTNVYISGGIFTNAGQAAFTGEGNIVVTGGQFDKDPSARVVPGYKAEPENGVYVVRKPQALIDFENAIANGNDVTLSDDLTLIDPVAVPEGKEVTINLNGKTLDIYTHKSAGAVLKNDGTLAIEGGTISSLGNNGGSAIANNGTLTVKNATLNGAPNADGSWPAYTVNNTGTMTLENSTITSKHGSVASYGEGAVLTLNNCTIDMAGIAGFTSHGIYTYNGGKVIINGGTYKNNATDQGATGASVINGNVEVNAGTFTGRIENYYGTPVLKGGTYSVKPNNAFVAEGYKVIEKDGKFNVVLDSVDNVATSDNSLDEAIKGGATTIALNAGEYVIPDSAKGKTITFIGTGNPEDTIIAAQDDGGAEGDCDYSLDGATVTFENVTITTTSTYFPGYARCKGTYKNCIINGVFTLYDNSSFEKCTFNVSGDIYNVWTWGAAEATFTNCTFNCDGKAMLLYGTANTKLTMNNCVFNDKGGLADLKAAIEIGNDYNKSYELIVNNATVNGFEINDKGIYTGTTLWANKNSMPADKLKVTVDGYTWITEGLVKKDNEYLVSSKNGLNYFSNKTADNGSVIKLATDINFEGAEFKAIAAGYDKSLTFDGQNHTIKNVKIATCSHNSVGAAGLFFCYTGGTLNVSNLVVEKATSEGGTYTGVITGYTQGNATLTNITVKECNISGVKKIGGIAGFVEASTTNFVAENCKVIDTTVAATEKQAGTIIGYNAKPATLKNCTVENSTATAPAYCDGGVRCTDPAQAELTIE